MGRIAAVAATLMLSTSYVFAQCAAQVGFGNFINTFALCDDSERCDGSLSQLPPGARDPFVGC